MLDMTDPSQQQPGYPTPEQQQAAYAQQQQAAAYAQQQQAAAYAQQGAPSILTKLPMNMLTLGLAGGGAIAIMVSLLILAAGDDFGSVYTTSSSILSPVLAVIVLTAITITTGDKFRNLLRAVVLGLVIYEVSASISLLVAANSPDAETVVSMLLLSAALGLFAAATFTMAPPAAPQAYPGMHPHQQAPHPTQQAPQQHQAQQPPQQGWQ